VTNILKDGETARFDRFGKVIGTFDNNGNEVVEDGQCVRVPLIFMDSKSMDGDQKPTFDTAHQRPRQGTMTMADQARKYSARQACINRTADAWKKGAR
jgi:hypothetical protein